MSENTARTGLAATPGQTIGPFYGYALPYEKGEQLVHPSHPQAVRLHGVVTDGHGAVVPDALLEIWQADGAGAVPTADGSLVRDGYTFTGFGRAAVDNVGHYTFTTVDPGPTEPGRAAFITLTVFARGLLNRLFTRIYLPEDTAALAADPLLRSLPEERRRTLIARREADGSLRFDVRLQGEEETVFLTYPNLAD
ncbi:protocatechuate 3,4-dioxygenase subunit alpha [Kocuria sp. LUK]|uniref:Protocatechuate 3,4-dioxygenase subunit alpha n=1 Tax=Kocuria flava TaxID=446860 RepID=A0A2N4T226_9MICC|nr:MULTISPECIES: protocatechuate 3,4-dioxygenase subunit alpha [Kocuria]MCD1146480.1 protocatechuate 3,4-dioxygenase subunit alpha [Kocuria sp. LUK]PLC12271.1 protocatechuate 3,4-dioxygenase subunit alpha [Kocuria flava]